jgi:CheY-like chemotaxis protein
LPDVIATELCTLLHSHGVDAPAIQADLAIMKSASLRAAQTIKDLLTLGRQGQAVKENFDLNLAIANMFKHDSSHLRPSLKRPEVISLELAPMPLVIHASESHVVRAVSNLVHNAVEALDGTGIVRIRTYPCLLSEVHSGFEPIDAGDYVVLAVADQGRGIAREDLSRVFEPFFSTKRLDETSGSGLGLAIVHGVVKEHHGFVDVHSELGSGTEFFLYFRRVDAPVAEAEKISFKPVPALRVLVVDDDPVQLRTAARVLTQMGHLVTAINSGLEAYSMMSAPTEGALIVDAPFDIVVIDMLLNEADDGLTIFEKIQRRFPAIRGIIVSGHSPTERTRLAVSRGLTWLPKPYTADALARSVRSALG